MIKEFKQVKSFVEYTKGAYNVLPLSEAMYSDMYTPMDVLRTLKGITKHCFILESIEDSTKDIKTWGRYTFLGFDPKQTISCQDGVVVIEKDGQQTTELGEPTQYIKKILDENRALKIDGMPPFCGGLVGYFAYDYVKYQESELKLKAKDCCFFRDVDLMLFDKVIAFDHHEQKIILIANIRIDGDLETEFNRGKLELSYIKKLIMNGTRTRTAPPSAKLKSDWKALFEKNEFCAMVKKAQQYIQDGEIGQVVLSNRFEADFEGSLFNTYRVLRSINPSPYMFYFSGTDFEFAGSSPETLVKLQEGKIYTYPLGGTRARGETPEEDKAIEAELLADKKELSEHDMLVDLGKEDLGKICKPGSVNVDNYMNILRFSHVMHIGSVISGDIRDGVTGLDAVGAVLPAGTLSGAPKVRSMEIIDELEKSKRGIYGGAIGYLDFAGGMDTCIAIRLAYKKNGKVYVRSGAGVVAESVPESEYRECVNKAAAVKIAVEDSQYVD
ncbi:MAG: anthranilate synthase component I family protein [Oscillospiraceae bacterium]|nr:anthranilate synthase component I family protein [Oscillospiraceae bacterium]